MLPLSSLLSLWAAQTQVAQVSARFGIQHIHLHEQTGYLGSYNDEVAASPVDILLHIVHTIVVHTTGPCSRAMHTVSNLQRKLPLSSASEPSFMLFSSTKVPQARQLTASLLCVC